MTNIDVMFIVVIIVAGLFSSSLIFLTIQGYRNKDLKEKLDKKIKKNSFYKRKVEENEGKIIALEGIIKNLEDKERSSKRKIKDRDDKIKVLKRKIKELEEKAKIPEEKVK